MRSDLSKRIAKLEGRGFQAAEIRQSYRDYVEHNIAPRDPRLAKIVKDLAATITAIEANAEGLDHDHQTAP